MHENRCENAAKMGKVGAYHANVFSKNRWAAKEDANLPQSVNRNRQHARAVSRSNLFTGMLRSNLSEKFLKIRPAQTITCRRITRRYLPSHQTMAGKRKLTHAYLRYCVTTDLRDVTTSASPCSTCDSMPIRSKKAFKSSLPRDEEVKNARMSTAG